MRYLVKNGLVLDPAASLEAQRDVLIEEGVIKEVAQPGALGNLAGAEIVDARGCWVTPGLVDLHVHLREPGFEWKESVASGAKAAISGGFTTICCMPNTRPTNSTAEITRFILEQARLAGLAKVRPIGSVSVGLEGKQLAPLSELWEAGCVAFSDDGEPVWDSALMRRALEWCTMFGARISCHEEDKRLSHGGCMHESALSLRLGLSGMPCVAEDVMVSRDIELARAFKGKVHICHVSSGRSVELIRRAKSDGIDISAEATPHHLLLTQERVAEYDSSAKMSPPLREQSDVEALRAGIADGTIDALASDHAPHELDAKRVEFAKASFGIIGLQTNLPLTLRLVEKGVISPLRAVELWTSGPARVFGLPCGTLRKGAAADLVVIDPKREWSFDQKSNLSKSANSPFWGEGMQGRAQFGWVDGRMVLNNGEVAR